MAHSLPPHFVLQGPAMALNVHILASGVLFLPSPEGTTGTAINIRRYTIEDSTEAKERVLQQIQTWFSLKHQNILPLLVATTEGSTISMLIPFMNKSALEYVQDRDVDPRPLLQGIANGLSYLHDQALVHGAIKGTNIFISDNGCPYIIIPKCTCRLYSFNGALSCICQRTTRWLAPEQVDGGNQTIESDVWAFGMTAVELFTSLPPFSDIQAAQGVLIKIVQGPPNRPSDQSTCSRMTDAWWNICLECMEMQAESRPQISHVAERIGEMVNEE